MATKVYLLDGGTLLLDQSLVTWKKGIGTDYRIPVYSLLIDHPDAKILVDTGFNKEQVERDLPFEKPEQTPEQTIPAQLAKIGLEPKDIDIVVHSHLHMDHCGANEFFKHARFIVNKHELRHAFVPEPFERIGYYRELFDFPGIKWELIEGDYEVVPGVKLISTPGHSIGHYSVLVELESGPLLYVVDAAWTRENWETEHPMGIHLDPVQLIQSIRRLKQIVQQTGARILISHDMEEYKGYKKAPDFYS